MLIFFPLSHIFIRNCLFPLKSLLLLQIELREKSFKNLLLVCHTLICLKRKEKNYNYLISYGFIDYGILNAQEDVKKTLVFSILGFLVPLKNLKRLRREYRYVLRQ